MTADFDVVVVGAGPAGSAAAIAAARTGCSVCLLERGPFPGSKNVFGGVLYGRILDQIIPHWWELAPIQRWVSRRSTMVMTERQAITVDIRAQAWASPPYNGATVYRPEFDAWFAGQAVAAGAVLLTSTTATGLLRDTRGHVAGVSTDRTDGDIAGKVVIACDGVNSFLAKGAGLVRKANPAHIALGVKEVLALPRHEIEARFGLEGDEGADFEILGCTGDVPGGGFLYTNRETLSIGAVLQLSRQGQSAIRPEEVVASLKDHPAIRPFVRDAELVEYAAHLIPEGGYHALGGLATDGLLVAGDAAGFCLAAGIWLEGMNYAIGSGMAAGATAAEAVQADDATASRLAAYRRRLEKTYVLKDFRRLKAAPDFFASERVQHRYPAVMGNMLESFFTVGNPDEKPRLGRLFRRACKEQKIGARHLLQDLFSGWRSFG